MATSWNTPRLITGVFGNCGEASLDWRLSNPFGRCHVLCLRRKKQVTHVLQLVSSLCPKQTSASAPYEAAVESTQSWLDSRLLYVRNWWFTGTELTRVSSRSVWFAGPRLLTYEIGRWVDPLKQALQYSAMCFGGLDRLQSDPHKGLAGMRMQG